MYITKNVFQDTESQLEPMVKEESGTDEPEGLGGAAEESPDQSISSAMPTDSGVGEGDGAPLVQDGNVFNARQFFNNMYYYWPPVTSYAWCFSYLHIFFKYNMPP